MTSEALRKAIVADKAKFTKQFNELQANMNALNGAILYCDQLTNFIDAEDRKCEKPESVPEPKNPPIAETPDFNPPSLV